MAGLSFDVDWKVKELTDLLRNEFPTMSGRTLSLIGSRARGILKKQYLSGQELNLSAFPVDQLGKRTIRSDVNRSRTQVKIYSYPVNLFERGRRLRDGRIEAGKFIITKKLKGDIENNLPSYVAESEKRIIQPIIKKIGL